MARNIEVAELGVEVLKPGVEGADTDDNIKFTYRAIDRIKEVTREADLPPGFFLRIGIRGGGCSGSTYFMAFDSDITDADREFFFHNIHIVIDSVSLFYLMGITLDYVNNDEKQGFVFTGLHNVPICRCVNDNDIK